MWPLLSLHGGRGSAQPTCYLLHPAPIPLTPHFSLILLKTVKTNEHFNASRPSEPAIKLHQKVDVQLTWFLLVRSVQRFCSLWTGKLCLKTECWQGGWRHWNEASPIFLGHEILCHSPKHPAGRNDALWLKCFYSVPVLWSKRWLY